MYRRLTEYGVRIDSPYAPGDGGSALNAVAQRARSRQSGGCVPDFIVRQANADDFEVVSDLYRRSSLSNERDREVLLANPEVLVFEDVSIREGRTRVAVDNGRVVGFATTRVVGDIAELDDLFVDPDWMRQGVARTLVDDAVAVAKTRGITWIEVTANPRHR